MAHVSNFGKQVHFLAHTREGKVHRVQSGALEAAANQDSMTFSRGRGIQETKQTFNISM